MMNDNPAKYLTSLGVGIEEFNLLEEAGQEFWHTLFKKDNIPVSGGFGRNKDYARKVAYSEFLERMKFREICASGLDSQKKWGIEIIPTACGFAVGFDKSNTVDRSVAEAVERWVMSKWIDDHYAIDEVVPEFSGKSDVRICEWFIEQFDEVRFFKHEVVVQLGGVFRKIVVAQTMGFRDGGIYPGSSGQSNDSNIWTHALLESFRHLLVVRNGNDFSAFPNDRIKFFSENSKLAITEIEKAKNKDWPIPKIVFHNYEYFQEHKFFLARTIIDGWQSWHLGGIRRFLY